MGHSKVIDDIVDELFDELFPCTLQENPFYMKFVDCNGIINTNNFNKSDEVLEVQKK